MKIVEVIWLDSETTQGWNPIEDVLSTPLIARSVGFLVKETKDFIMLAHSLDEINHNYNGSIRIPRCAVKKIKTLRA